MQCEVHDKSGTHCQNNVTHKFQFNGKEVYLCSQCFANVCNGAYGIDLQLSAVASNTDFNLTGAGVVPIDCERRKIMGKLEDWDKTKKAKQKEYELYKSDAVYRFLTNQICSASSEILRVKQEIKKLSEKQVELKRGRSALVELRRDLLSRKKA